MKEYLFHYTKCKSCLSILENKTLLFNKLSNMNDINELYRPLFFSEDKMNEKEMGDVALKFVSNYQQISLTSDGKRRGFDIPAMWGHYAENGLGACVVFDKSKLIQCIDKNPFVVQCGTITYSNDFSSSIHLSNDESNGKIKENSIKENFFEKTTDWSYEQEFRIIAYAPDKNDRLVLNIRDSIEKIILYDHPFARNHKDRDILREQYKTMLLFYSSFINERNVRNVDGECKWSSIDWENLKLDI